MKLIKTTSILLICIIIMLLLTTINSYYQHPVEKPIAKQGFLDSTAWNFKEKGLLPLAGEWEFYWMELLKPRDFIDKDRQLEKNFIKLPAELSQEQLKGEKLSGQGFATLRLQLKVEDLEKSYGLKSRYFASANKVWVNGVELSSIGKVAKNPANYQAQYLPLESIFETEHQQIEIIIQIANFHHRRLRLGEVFFAPAEQIYDNTYRSIIKESILFGSLFLIALYYFILYLIQQRGASLLYFSVISLIVAIRVAIVNERILLRIIPSFDPEIMMKLGYAPVFLLLPLFILYLEEVIEDCKLDKFAQIAKYTLILFTIVITGTTVKTYDWLFNYLQWLLYAAALYIIYLMLKGLFAKKKNTLIMAAGSIIILLTALNDSLRELDIINTPELLSIGIFIFILLQAIFLAWRLNDAFIRSSKLAQENKTMYKKLEKSNQLLESKVRARTLELEKANHKLKKISRHDPLTGLANRRFFKQRLELEWNKSLREKKPLSLIMIDIDCFKPYNDNYGHPQGDQCLKKIAAELAQSLNRKTDFVARYGGEEFIVLLPNTDPQGANKIAEKIRIRIESLKIEHQFSQVKKQITISLGTNTLTVTNKDSQAEFINQADQALYLAKEKGRNQVYSL